MEGIIESEEIAKENSPYGLITVTESDKVRSLMLGGLLQSSLDMKNFDRMIDTYIHLIAAAICGTRVKPPIRFLMIGLGAGVLAHHIDRYYPDAHLSIVELDPVVAKFALLYFYLPASVHLHIGDGRKFLEETKQSYDIIIMDAFSENYIPPQLMTAEFVQLIKQRLNSQGVYIINTWALSKTNKDEKYTYRRAFRSLFQFHYADQIDENRIFLASDAEWDLSGLLDTIRKCAQKRNILSIDLQKILPYIEEVEYNGGTVLYDGFWSK